VPLDQHYIVNVDVRGIDWGKSEKLAALDAPAHRAAAGPDLYMSAGHEFLACVVYPAH
jgi:hypothetical protein